MNAEQTILAAIGVLLVHTVFVIMHRAPRRARRAAVRQMELSL